MESGEKTTMYQTTYTESGITMEENPVKVKPFVAVPLAFPSSIEAIKP